MYWFFYIARSVVWFLFTIIFNIEYVNVEKIPKREKGYIMACNHTSYLDPLMIAFKNPKWVRYMAKSELTHIKGLGWLFRWLGIVPVERGSADMSAIDRCAELTREGYVLGIFPEGTRYPEGEPGKPKSGMALIAKMTQADVLPCAVRYQRPLGFRTKVTVTYGDLIPYEELGLDEESHRALKKATKRVWEDVIRLMGLEEKADEA